MWETNKCLSFSHQNKRTGSRENPGPSLLPSLKEKLPSPLQFCTAGAGYLLFAREFLASCDKFPPSMESANPCEVLGISPQPPDSTFPRLPPRMLGPSDQTRTPALGRSRQHPLLLHTGCSQMPIVLHHQLLIWKQFLRHSVFVSTHPTCGPNGANSLRTGSVVFCACVHINGRGIDCIHNGTERDRAEARARIPTHTHTQARESQAFRFPIPANGSGAH